MKKLNHRKLFKATLVTAVAGGAIVAVAPANTEAATRTFSDVKDIPSHHFYEAVMDLSSRGIIGGYPDGTFKPGQSISRQHAAKFLALTLGLDTVNVKDPGFKDVNKNNPYYGAIAALVEAGIISGYADNTFKPNDNLTRTQMAKMLVLGFNLKSQGEQNNPFNDISASNWNKSFVQVLYTNNITSGTTPTTFSPNAFVTRGQLASFLFRSEAATQGSKPMPEPEPVPEVSNPNQKALDAAYFQVTGGTLEISYGDNATDEQKLAAVQTYATSLIKEQGVVAKVTKGKRAGLYVVTLTKGGAKVEKTITIKFESKAGTHYIKEVKALNAKQVEVTFATPISKSTVVDGRNVVQNITFSTNTGSASNPGQLTGVLSTDGKTLTITASGTFNGEYTFSATDSIKSTTNEPLDKYTATVKLHDTIAPRLVSGSASAKTSTTSFSLFFDEPVNATGATAYVNNTVATITNNPTDPKRLDITTRTAVQVGATARISVTNVKDYNSNSTSPNPVETTITVVADKNAPTVTNAKVTADHKIEVTYDKDMDISSFAGKARIVHANGSVTQLTASAGWNARTVILSGESSIYNNMYNSVLYIDADVKDTAGYSTALYSTNLNFNQDTIPPRVYGIASGQVQWDMQTVTFTISDENSGVNLDSVKDIYNYTWDGRSLPSNSYVSTSILSGSSDKATSVAVIVHIPINSISTKTAAFTVNHIRDNAGNGMVHAVSEYITLGNDFYNQPEFTSASVSGYDNSSLILTFSKTMDGNTVDANDFEIILNGYSIPSHLITPLYSYDYMTFTTGITASVKNYTNANGNDEHSIYLDLDGNGEYDLGELVLEVVDGHNLYDSVPVNLYGHYVSSLTVRLIQDSYTPAKDYIGNYARYGQQYSIR
ncbi:S-layer homology domain-containing protein [Sporosarcina sp. SAFN-015]|uniref:S-layer homology domain-containing protein n=1 Tax=Sporosarcina sp. SAFN-015 TaxID=3387274 RepID=UPI003F809B62